MPSFVRKCNLVLCAGLLLVLGCGTDPGSTSSIGGSAITYFTYSTGELRAILNVEDRTATLALVLFDTNTETGVSTQVNELEAGVSVTWPESVTFYLPDCNDAPTLLSADTYSTLKIFHYVYPTSCTPASADTISTHAELVVSKSGYPDKVVVSDPWVHEAYVKAPNADAGDYFGWSVGVSGDTVVVGAWLEASNQTTITNGTTASSDNSQANTGAAYVFRKTGTTWAQEAYLKASNANFDDRYGQSVAISDDTIVVGAYLEDSNQTTVTNGTTASSNNGTSDAGAAYVYKRTGTTWEQEAYLKPPNPDANDHFGYSVAISSDTIVVGADLEDSNQTTITNGTTASGDNSADAAGAVYVFKRTGTTWAQEAYLKAPNAETGDYFGNSVAVSGDTVVVGTQYEDSNQTTITNGTTASSNNGANMAGAAYVFRRTGTTWAQEAYLKAPNAQAVDTFGISVGISSDTIVVGAESEDSNQTTITNGTTATSDNSAASSGAAYVFRRTGTTWAQEAYLKASNAEGSDLFGFQVAISGNTIAVSARGEDSSQTTVTNGSSSSSDNSASASGAVYVFRRSGTRWAQEAYLKAPNAEANDHFGYSLAISSDTIVTSSYEEDSNQTSITHGTTVTTNNGSSNSGAVYIFNR